MSDSLLKAALVAAYIVSFFFLGGVLILSWANVMRFAATFREPASPERTRTLRTASIRFMLGTGVSLAVVVSSRLLLSGDTSWYAGLALTVGSVALGVTVLYFAGIAAVKGSARQLDAWSRGEVPSIENGTFFCGNCGRPSDPQSVVVHNADAPPGEISWKCFECGHTNAVNLSSNDWLRNLGIMSNKRIEQNAKR